MFMDPVVLIVVYKDELALNFFRKLVETNNDGCEKDTVGDQKSTIRIVAWTEKIWLEQKKAGNINNKVLFLGDIKGVNKLLPIVDLKYNEYGIRYGWAGTQALLFAKVDFLKKESYQTFFEEFCKLPVPEDIKVNAYSAKNAAEKKDLNRVLRKVVGGGLGTLFGAPITGAAVADSADIMTTIQNQKLVFGICKLYENHLNEFINN